MIEVNTGVIAIPSVVKDLQDACERGELALMGFLNNRIQSTRLAFHEATDLF